MFYPEMHSTVYSLAI